MDRHFATARLASGILFSPPAGIDAKPDVWDPRSKKRKQQFDSDPREYGMECQDQSVAPSLGGAYYTQLHPGDYSVFPHFVGITRVKGFAQQVPSDHPSQSLLSSHPSRQSPATLCLPILRVSADVSIDGTISHTKLTQSFHNPSKMIIHEARHSFPLYHGSVVTSFECKIGDSRRLQGVVKPTAQARREFEDAKETKREAAALLEEHVPEIFETSLGNIPANTTVEINLTYVHELKVVTSKEKCEGLAVIIPASIAPIYATVMTPASLPEVPCDRLEVIIRVLDNGSIDPHSSRVESNHRSTTYRGLRPSSNVLITNITELHNLNSATNDGPKLQHLWQYTSKSRPILQGDFVFVIQMREKTRLQSHAIITPANDMGHAALMVSLRPNDLFGSAVRPEQFRGEILFVLDRSASMGWTQEGTNGRKIETLRNSMSLALSGLPSTCKFNIISFGSEVRGMWVESQRADELENLSHAREYVAGITANMGGTKVLLALNGAVSSCEPNCPSTQIILITDGEIEDEPHDAILNHVWENRKKYGEKIRYFTLGIGDSVSHSVMESIAELGGGYCDVVDVVKNSRWEGSLNRMLRSVMEPDSWTCDIDIGPRYKRQSLVASKFGTGDEGDTDFIQYAQGPHPIPSLQPFRYKSFFFLLDLKDAKLPTTVTIKTTSKAAKKKVYSMDIKMAQLRGGTIHPLAVKAILRSLEDEVKRTGTSGEQARLNAEHLGTKYAISSNWTSFIAVADGHVEQDCHIDTYKSRFREADIKELLVSTSEENLKVPRNIPPYGMRIGCVPESTNHTDDLLPLNRDITSYLPVYDRYVQNSLTTFSDNNNNNTKSVVDVYEFEALDMPEIQDADWWEAVDTWAKPVTRTTADKYPKHEDVLFYRPSSDGSISWQDAAGCEKDGVFILPAVVQKRLRQHFCGTTVEHLHETLRNLLDAVKVANAERTVLIDTLMMIQYFKTHLVTQEDYWSLVIDKAERALLSALGHDDGQEEALEPIYKTLLSSIRHVHFAESLKRASKHQKEVHKSIAASASETCLVCNAPIERDGKKQPILNKVYACLVDECYDKKAQGRKIYTNWGVFWDHQVSSGHLLCPEFRD